MGSEVLQYIDHILKEGDIDELSLEDMSIPKITPDLKKKLESIPELLGLSLNNCKLKSLANFPELKDLNRLELVDNPFPAADLVHLARLENLQSLSLNGCNIQEVSDLKPLKNLKKLMQLDLGGTKLSENLSCSTDVFGLLDSLQILYNQDGIDNEVEYSDDEEETDTDSEDFNGEDDFLEEDDEDAYAEEEDEEEDYSSEDEEKDSEYSEEDDDDDETNKKIKNK